MEEWRCVGVGGDVMGRVERWRCDGVGGDVEVEM